MFVMPNIPVVNDVEGFGLVALEAASCGTMVVASQLEGIQDAIIDGKNGTLVPSTDAAKYVEVITQELAKPRLTRQAIRDYTLANFSWTKAADQYAAIMQRLATRK
jgi:glycosyltransferase involved in cell wall biosynthesis